MWADEVDGELARGTAGSLRHAIIGRDQEVGVARLGGGDVEGVETPQAQSLEPARDGRARRRS